VTLIGNRTRRLSSSFSTFSIRLLVLPSPPAQNLALMLQLKSLQDARRPRANLSGCPSRLHSANSLAAAGRASPTSGTLRTGFVGPAGGSGRALAGGRAHRGLGGAHWLNKQTAPVGLKCRAVAVEARSSPVDAPRSAQHVSTESPKPVETAPELPTSATSATLSEVDVTVVEVHTERVAASAASPTRPRLPSRKSLILCDDDLIESIAHARNRTYAGTESEGFELVAAEVPLVEAPPDFDDWEIVSPDDLTASALS
jgi:hypothetical protein